MKNLCVFAVIHYGNYKESGEVVDDACPCCKWNPWLTTEGKAWADHHWPHEGDYDPAWHLGNIWAPGAEKGTMGAHFQVFKCQGCGLVYGTHLG